MSNYVKSTDFAQKDVNNDIIQGSEFEVEFDAIAVATNSKLDPSNNLSDVDSTSSARSNINASNVFIEGSPVNLLDTTISPGSWTTITSGAPTGATAVLITFGATTSTATGGQFLEIAVRKPGSTVSISDTTNRNLIGLDINNNTSASIQSWTGGTAIVPIDTATGNFELAVNTVSGSVEVVVSRIGYVD